MILKFYKYHGAGNDFIILNNLENQLPFIPDTNIIQKMCARHFGIGADGLIILEKSRQYDFNMRYFNSDGYQGTMCGNGGRCAVALAGCSKSSEMPTVFTSDNLVYVAEFKDKNIIALKMNDVPSILTETNYFIVDTGSPHYVQFVNNISNMNVLENGRKIRYAEQFMPAGINVNFIEVNGDHLKIRTYERGVENITLACGTGSVAAAIAAIANKPDGHYTLSIENIGGVLEITLDKIKSKYTNIWLTGPVKLVYEGVYKI